MVNIYIWYTLIHSENIYFINVVFRYTNYHKSLINGNQKTHNILKSYVKPCGKVGNNIAYFLSSML